jgi:fructose-bisphosphate aldolase class II
MKAPALNKERKFSDNLKSAHELLLMAKNGQKGNKKETRYAIPAFNVTNFQSIDAVMEAAEKLGSSVMLAFSNSALKHFGRGNAIRGLEFVQQYVALAAKYSSVKIATHLDHGDYIGADGRKLLQAAVQSLTSVMADNSTDHENEKPTDLKLNIEATAEVVNMAHPLGVSVEGELGVLAGVEDEDTQSDHSSYTDPEELLQFLKETGVLMLAPTIGTMHGPNKGKPGHKVKLNITLAHECLKIADQLNTDIVFVAHGASTLYPHVVDFAASNLEKMGELAQYAQNWKNFVGTDWDQIEGLIKAGFCKINTDTENRQTYLAAWIGALKKNAAKIDIRHYEKTIHKAMVNCYMQKLVMSGNYGVWHEPKIDLKEIPGSFF